MISRWICVFRGSFSRIATTLVLVATLSLSGCCAFCGGTICAPGTKVDPDGGGVIVDRDDDVVEVRGGKCIPD